MTDKWHEIVGYFDSNSMDYIEHKHVRTVIRGDVDGAILVQVQSDLAPDQAHATMANVQATMRASGIDRPLILMPDSISLMKTRELTPSEARTVEDMIRLSEHDGVAH